MYKYIYLIVYFYNRFLLYSFFILFFLLDFMLDVGLFWSLVVQTSTEVGHSHADQSGRVTGPRMHPDSSDAVQEGQRVSLLVQDRQF